jgi:two-component system LytT family response regulator
MTSIRTVIVEDEPLARQRLRGLLEAETDVQIISECCDGRTAAAAIRDMVPDLVFLDVQMPELDGFAVLEQAGAGETPAIVFVTAYSEYALRGFAVHALDYLLKPFDEDRFREAMRRVRERLGQRREVDVSRDLLTAFERLRTASAGHSGTGNGEAPLTRLVVRDRGRVYFLRVDEIAWIGSAGNYIRAHTGRSRHLVRISMKELERRLPAGRFARIHRGLIVNLEQVREIEPHLHGDYRVVLRDGTVLRMSRRYRANVLDDA